MPRLPLRTSAPLLGLLLLSGCHAPLLAVRDPARAAAVRKVVVMPFFVANTLSAEAIGTSGLFNTTQHHWAGDFAKRLGEARPGRYEIVCCETVEAALARQGGFQRAPATGMPAGWRTGYTFAEAQLAARELGADAFIIGAVAWAEGEQQAKDFFTATSMRMMDTATGNVVLGASAAQGRWWFPSALGKLVKKLKEAP